MKTFKLVLLIAMLGASGVVAMPVVAEDLTDIAASSRYVDAWVRHISVNGADASAQEVSLLRSFGAPGLDALLAYQKSHPENQNILAAVDAVAGQKGALDCRLFWYNDLKQAKEVAARSNKPILYLRLLGKLTDEYSCANSRFFARFCTQIRMFPPSFVRILFWCGNQNVLCLL